MIVIGITGSIGMGKSVIAEQFSAAGVPHHSADKAVHELLKNDASVIEAVKKHFPKAVKKNQIDRAVLGDTIFFDPQKRKALEHILHVKVAVKESLFIEKHKRLGSRMVALDIPLLYETGSEKACDVVVVVTAPPAVQERRVLRRKNMTGEKYRAILAAQMSDQEKKERADYVIETGLGKAHSFRQVKKILAKLHDA